MLKTRFSKHGLIKISTACVPIKPEVKKKDISAMNAAPNEDCIGDKVKIAILFGTFEKGRCKFIKGDFSGGGNE